MDQDKWWNRWLKRQAEKWKLVDDPFEPGDWQDIDEMHPDRYDD